MREPTTAEHDRATAPSRRFDVAFRVFNDGVGFRYDLPAQPGLGAFEIMEELTEFAMADDARAWWIPSNRPRMDRSEFLYSSSPVSVLDSVQTPLTMESRDGRTFIVIHEAHLVDYPRMFIKGPYMQGRTLRAALAPLADGVKARGRTPFATPWRTIQLADRASDLAPSVLGLNLNPPSVIENTGWIRPMKYVGIWWGMHIGTMTWGSGPKHGATTANTKRYIDFAAANGFGGVLVEGWNTGWDGDWIQNANAFSFTKAVVDRFVTELGRSMASRTRRADLDWHFAVVNAPEVNAFALPGGFVYVNRGAIEQAERLDELAGIMGHEIGHVVRRHGVEQVQKARRGEVGLLLLCTLTRACSTIGGRVAVDVSANALSAHYSQRDEAQADSEGVLNTVRAGIDPEGLPSFFQELLDQQKLQPGVVEAFFSTHPTDQARISATRQQIARLAPPPSQSLHTEINARWVPPRAAGSELTARR